MRALLILLFCQALGGCAVTDTARAAMERCHATRELVVETSLVKSISRVLCDGPGPGQFAPQVR
jgi:hypothetical protein